MTAAHPLLRATAAYAAWFITAGLGVVDLLAARALLLEVYYALGITFWARGAVENGGILVFAVVWVILIYICESYYRGAAAVNMRRLLTRFATVTAVQVLFFGLANLVVLLISAY